MKKVMIIIFVLIMLAVAFGDTSDIEVNVVNTLPDVVSVNVGPDERAGVGVQINKTGADRTVTINATIEDLNGLKQISYVRAYISGESDVEESPLELVNTDNITNVRGYYTGSFVLEASDNTGDYVVNVTVHDGIGKDFSLIDVKYLSAPTKIITVCSSGCN